jgi:hypothetical protein
MPTNPLSATITNIKGRWYAVFTYRNRKHTLPVSQADAWTFDVETGLEVRIRLVKGIVKVQGRWYMRVEGTSSRGRTSSTVVIPRRRKSDCRMSKNHAGETTTC